MSSFTVFLKVSGGEKLSLDVTPKQTIAELKAAVAGKCDIPAENQRLIYKGQVLKDEKTVEDYGEPEPSGDMGLCCMSFFHLRNYSLKLTSYITLQLLPLTTSST